jgi:hypothetical protein
LTLGIHIRPNALEIIIIFSVCRRRLEYLKNIGLEAVEGIDRFATGTGGGFL